MNNSLCETCRRPLPVEPVPEPVEPVEPVVEPLPAEPVVFHAKFIEIVNKLPGTVLAKVLAKLRRCDLEPTTDSSDVQAVLEAANAAYAVKRNRAKVSSARARIAKKAEKVTAALAAAALAAAPVAEPAEPAAVETAAAEPVAAAQPVA